MDLRQFHKPTPQLSNFPNFPNDSFIFIIIYSATKCLPKYQIRPVDRLAVKR
jgi:hypothetical protein